MKPFIIATLLSAACAVGQSAERPAVPIIMVDDLGFSDLGCYGSEIETPKLDTRAANGLRFSQFYNTAKCHSSRVSLSTGAYCHQAGDTRLDPAVTSAEVLSRAGYFTAMTGKWRLRKEPTDFGFDRYFGRLSGSTNYFWGDDTFRLNGGAWKPPREGFYNTVANVEHAIDFLGEARAAKKPWYFYIAFNTPHAPLQPLRADYEKYQGRYGVGWDVIRERRLAKQRELGLLPVGTRASSRPKHIRAWSQLSAEWQDFEARRMTALAGLIDRVDQELGRLLADVCDADGLNNTFVLFVSSNGVCPYDQRSRNPHGEPYEPKTRWSDSPGWAWRRNSPFRYSKQNQFEGGVCTPAIVHWPAGLKTEPGAIVRTPAHLFDVLPTLAEICEAPIPGEWPERSVKQVSGVSLKPLLNGEPLERTSPLHFLYGNDRALRDGNWKAVSFGRKPWELYNLADDRTELRDLATRHPERLSEVTPGWHRMAADLLDAPAKVRRPVMATPRAYLNPRCSDYERAPGSGAPQWPAPNSLRAVAAVDRRVACEPVRLRTAQHLTL